MEHSRWVFHAMSSSWVPQQQALVMLQDSLGLQNKQTKCNSCFVNSRLQFLWTKCIYWFTLVLTLWNSPQLFLYKSCNIPCEVFSRLPTHILSPGNLILFMTNKEKSNLYMKWKLNIMIMLTFVPKWKSEHGLLRLNSPVYIYCIIIKVVIFFNRVWSICSRRLKSKVF